MKQRQKTKRIPAGHALLSLMAEAATPVRMSDLARDLGVTPTSVHRYFKDLDAGTISDDAWFRLADVLITKYGIAADQIRPVNRTVSVDTSLMPYLDAFTTKAQLEALTKILERSDKQQARDVLLVLARDRINRRG
jgi:AcrR family transcriptional regulator